MLLTQVMPSNSAPIMLRRLGPILIYLEAHLPQTTCSASRVTGTKSRHASMCVLCRLSRRLSDRNAMVQRHWNKLRRRTPHYYNEADWLPQYASLKASSCALLLTVASGEVRTVRLSYLAELGYPNPASFGILTIVPQQKQFNLEACKSDRTNKVENIV